VQEKSATSERVICREPDLEEANIIADPPICVYRAAVLGFEVYLGKKLWFIRKRMDGQVNSSPFGVKVNAVRMLLTTTVEVKESQISVVMIHFQSPRR